MKKIPFIITLVLLFVISISSVIFFTLYPRFIYEYSEKYNGYLVTDFKGVKSEITIPKTYKDKNVVGIGARAFYKNNKLEKVIFESEHIIVIEKLAFSECTSLKEIDLSKVDNIERNAFSYDSSLTSINLNAINLGSSVFYGCTSLEKINLGDNLKTIGSFIFAKSKINTLTFPITLETVAEDTFAEMTNLKEINIYKNRVINGINYLNSLEGIKINNLSN